MTDLIEHILDTVDKKCVQSDCKKILNKCSLTSNRDLGNVVELAVWLYVYGFYNEAVAICDILKDIPFTGNHTLWENVDSALCVKARILREQGKSKERAEIICRVNKHRHPELYANSTEWFTQTLDANIKSNLEAHSKSGARSWRLLKLEAAIKYREAEKFPVSDDDLESVIKELVNILATER